MQIKIKIVLVEYEVRHQNKIIIAKLLESFSCRLSSKSVRIWNKIIDQNLPTEIVSLYVSIFVVHELEFGLLIERK